MTEGGDQGRQGGWGQPGGYEQGGQQGWQPQYGQDQGQRQQPQYGQQSAYASAPTYNEQQQYGQPWGAPPPGYGGTTDYASWGSRALALILDAIFSFVLAIPGLVALFVALGNADTVDNPDGTTEVTNVSGGLVGLAVALFVAAFLVGVWNQGWRQGAKGWSWGKQIMKIKLVKSSTLQPPGGGLGIGRWLLRSVLGVIPFFFLVDYLFPLWDEKHQTITDKIVSTYVVNAR